MFCIPNQENISFSHGVVEFWQDICCNIVMLESIKLERVKFFIAFLTEAPWSP
jgi:hypothetical protein